MNTKFVRILFDVRVKDLTGSPAYRIFVDKELFNERVWRWGDDTYLEELIQFKAAAGIYQISIQKIDQTKTEILASNLRIDHGDAIGLDNNRFEVY